MKTLPLIVLTVTLSLLAGAMAGTLMSDRPDEADPEREAELARLTATVAELQRERQELREAIDGLTLRLSSVGEARPQVAMADIDRAVERYMAGGDLMAVEPTDDIADALATLEGEELAALDVESAVASLLGVRRGGEEWNEIFQEVREAGLLEDVIAIFEQRARANPHDPEIQVDLGDAYLQKIFEVGNGPEAGIWATKADAAFDAALALDENHWDARFTKAISLSFWPPIFGKRAEAIREFETLIDQQKHAGPQKHHAQTYYLLGNLYLQSGDSAKAQSIYQAGLDLFPDDADLLSMLDG
jgi:tetratricopeptide (TPR) repeat protein